ncbi:hypothetical protein F5X99DRAFT_48437 [Biscogniauxia marginata]|nr:hypothetical protein F5X99DRAFT_48437 [Biscogniauxia marginata]
MDHGMLLVDLFRENSQESKMMTTTIYDCSRWRARYDANTWTTTNQQDKWIPATLVVLRIHQISPRHFDIRSGRQMLGNEPFVVGVRFRRNEDTI